MQESDYRFIQKFNHGWRLPYSKYDDAYIEAALLRKRNNAAAITVCLDALTSYVEDPDTQTKAENINMLYDEMATFCLNGLFGIGFFGVSVENGFPVRVDSCGVNISRQYRSVYRDMEPADYEALDRIESMMLDQREERKFRQYILKYKYALEGTLSTILDESAFADESGSEEIEEALALDQLFCTVCVKINRTDPARAANNVWGSPNTLSDLKMLLAPYRGLLHNTGVAVIGDYTIADLKPVSNTEIRRYQQATETPSVKMPVVGDTTEK